MSRRTLVIAVFVVAVLACAAAPALAREVRRSPGAPSPDSAATVTFTPRITTVRYATAVHVSGYLTSAGQPVAGGTVTLHETRDGVTRDGGTAVTDGKGFYQTTVTPRFNASWHAEAAGVSSLPVVILVRPRVVTLALSHAQSGTRLTEVLSGVVTPKHAGMRVLVQRSTATGWRTVASGRLDQRSHYRVRWLMPYRSATYRLRVLLPAHGDHADGLSQTSLVRVSVS